MINWHTFFFLLFALAACGFAVAVVLANHIVRMAFYLILSLGAVAGLFFLAGADLVGAMQLMIYVGGTLVLLVFGVMLTAQGPWVSMKTGPLQLLASALVGGSLLVLLVWAAWSIPEWHGRTVSPNAEAPPTATRLGLGLTGIRVDQLQQKDPLLRQGMSGYLLPFEIVSVHLLVVLVGAAFLARAKKRRAGKRTSRETNGP
jgi:NADH:ubiquinone oxidoreductase subunit 6 (subunit J)